MIRIKKKLNNTYVEILKIFSDFDVFTWSMKYETQLK